MFWFCVALPISVIIAVVGIIVAVKFSDSDDLLFSFGTIGIICALCALTICIVCPVLLNRNKREVAQFEQQKAYIEQRQQSEIDDIENAALTSKKIELNAQLYDWQYSYEHYGFFTLVPERVMDLTPIE